MLSPEIEVLDAGAMIAYLRGEAGKEVVEALLLDPDVVCVAHAVNVCEVFYDFLRSDGEADAHAAIGDLLSIGVQVCDDLDFDFWQSVGRLKVDPGGMALADCFGIAFTQRTGGEFVTADHHELDRIVPLNLCRIRFFR